MIDAETTTPSNPALPPEEAAPLDFVTVLAERLMARLRAAVKGRDDIIELVVIDADVDAARAAFGSLLVP